MRSRLPAGFAALRHLIPRALRTAHYGVGSVCEAPPVGSVCEALPDAAELHTA